MNQPPWPPDQNQGGDQGRGGYGQDPQYPGYGPQGPPTGSYPQGPPTGSYPQGPPTGSYPQPQTGSVPPQYSDPSWRTRQDLPAWSDQQGGYPGQGGYAGPQDQYGEPAAGQAAQQRKVVLWSAIALAAVVVVAAVVVIVALNRGSSNTAAGDSPATQATTAPQSAAPSTAATSASASKSGGSGSGSCKKPCGELDGLVIEVSDLKTNVPAPDEYTKPDAGNVYVTIQITAKNGGSQKATVDPFLFELTDAKGISRNSELLGPCDSWSGVDIQPGAEFGPKCLGFQATEGATDKLTLTMTNFTSSDELTVQLP